MKKLKWLLIFALTVCCLALAAGCANGLPKPTDLKVDDTTLTLSWSPVENATNYIIDIGGRQYVSRKPSYSLTGLVDGNYKIKVKANDTTGTYGDSAWSDTLDFVKEYDGGLEFSLTNGNTEYVLTKAGVAQGEVVIEDTYRGLPVTSIAPRAFYSNSRITSVKIGNNVKTIGAYAFTNCSQITSIQFGNKVETIGENAFQACRGLTSVTLPDSLTALGGYAFRYCRNLQAVTFGNSLKEISTSVFTDCVKLSSLTLPQSVKAIGESAFSGCTSLKEVDLGGVATIGASAFISCTGLTSVTGGNYLTEIGDSAFIRCEKLSEINLQGSIKRIGISAFAGCSALKDVKIGENVESIGNNAFYGTGVVAADKSENGIFYADGWVIGCVSIGTDGAPVIKEGTVGIAENAFGGITQLNEIPFQQVNLPASVKYIGDYAFAGCTNLAGLDLGSGVESIGKYAFANCTLLGRAAVSLGTNLKSIGSYAFQGCRNFGNPAYMGDTSKIIPSTVMSIGTYAFKNTHFWDNTSRGIVYVGNWAVGYISNPDETNITVRGGTVGISNYAFYQNKEITTVELPQSLKYLGMAAFNGCTSLGYVFIDELCGITEISDYAFYKCESLVGIGIPLAVTKIGRSSFYKSGIAEVNIPTRISEIDDYAFYNCTKLIRVNFTDNSRLTKIGNYTFCGCSQLASIVVPDGVISIGSRAFSRCSLLASVTLNSGLTELGSFAFNACTSLESIVLPDSITHINEKTFYKCSALTSVTFGNNVTYIGNYAFYACASLTKVDLPSTLKELGNYAFRGCTGLTAVILRSSVQTIGSHVFNGCRYMTIFTDFEERAEGWNGRWNSGYRPVIWGCTLSQDGTYVVSFVKDDGTVSYPTAQNGMSVPVRDGYTFVGWSTIIDGNAKTVNMEDITELPDGTVLQAMWEISVGNSDITNLF